ncbi:MAG: hypothetical protein IJ449_09985 [Clostridia bacterium]|nr:hypothetical protein [Clostridia bacterium]
MNKTTRILTLALALLLCISVCGFAVFAEEETTYEGSDLPVSESYVIRALNALEEKLNKKIDTLAESLGAALPDDTTAPETEITTPETDAPEVAAPADTSYTVVALKKGQSITGPCELILRSGTAVALCPGANGLSDLTAGADIGNGTAITANHLLLVPRDDGRGLTVTSEEAYIMVRGTYVIQ